MADKETRVYAMVGHGVIADSYWILLTKNSYKSIEDKKMAAIPITKERAQELCKELDVEIFEY